MYILKFANTYFLLCHNITNAFCQHDLLLLMLPMITCCLSVYQVSSRWYYSFPLSILHTLERNHTIQLTLKEKALYKDMNDRRWGTMGAILEAVYHNYSALKLPSLYLIVANVSFLGVMISLAQSRLFLLWVDQPWLDGAG